MTKKEVLEEVAKAIYRRRVPATTSSWDELSVVERGAYFDAAREAIAAYERAKGAQ